MNSYSVFFTHFIKFIDTNNTIEILNEFKYYPLSARTIAPAAKYLSPVSLSKITAAVKPTPEVPLPVVLITNGAIHKTLLNNYDFAVDGSPITKILISPLKCVPFSRVFSIPPSNISNIANLISSCPYIDGAIDYDSILSTSYFSAKDFIFLTSSIVTYGYSISVIITFMFKHIRLHLNTPLKYCNYLLKYFLNHFLLYRHLLLTLYLLALSYLLSRPLLLIQLILVTFQLEPFQAFLIIKLFENLHIDKNYE